jgi:hypothetical protein
MQMNYKIVQSTDRYSIFETSTDQIIKTFLNFNDARKFLRHMNLGGGFDSWTPNFFLRDFTTYINKGK